MPARPSTRRSARRPAARAVIHNGLAPGRVRPGGARSGCARLRLHRRVSRRSRGIGSLLDALGGLIAPEGQPATLAMAGGGPLFEATKTRLASSTLSDRVELLGVQPGPRGAAPRPLPGRRLARRVAALCDPRGRRRRPARDLDQCRGHSPKSSGRPPPGSSRRRTFRPWRAPCRRYSTIRRRGRRHCAAARLYPAALLARRT